MTAPMLAGCALVRYSTGAAAEQATRDAGGRFARRLFNGWSLYLGPRWWARVHDDGRVLVGAVDVSTIPSPLLDEAASRLALALEGTAALRRVIDGVAS